MKLLRIGNRWINVDNMVFVEDHPSLLEPQINWFFGHGEADHIAFGGTERDALLRWLALNDSVLDTTFVTVATIPPVTKPVGVELAPELVDMSLEGFKKLVKRGGFVVLDTETTGLHDGEICQIAIIDSDGNTLLDTYVKTKHPIPADAQRIHGISDGMVASAPTWAEIAPRVKEILSGKDVVIYNAVYDRKMMHRSAEHAGMEKIEWKDIARFWCAMEAYAEYYGAWNDHHQSYRWQKLTDAVRQCGIRWVRDEDAPKAHSALGDCRMTLAVIKRMAEV